jgi:hypothetical protein
MGISSIISLLFQSLLPLLLDLILALFGGGAV